MAHMYGRELGEQSYALKNGAPTAPGCVGRVGVGDAFQRTRITVICDERQVHGVNLRQTIGLFVVGELHSLVFPSQTGTTNLKILVLSNHLGH